jgi:hypothetical protein
MAVSGAFRGLSQSPEIISNVVGRIGTSVQQNREAEKYEKEREEAQQKYKEALAQYSGEAGRKLAKENAAQLAQNQMAAAQSAAQSSARTSGMGKAASAALGGQAGGQAYSQNFQQGYQTELARNQQAIENAKAKLDEYAALENENYQRAIGSQGLLAGLFSDENLKKIYYKIKEES